MSVGTGEIRLQVFLARAGLGSRRSCEQLIAAGDVTVNGTVVSEAGTKVDPNRDHVKVRGRRIGRPELIRHLLLHKPKGVVSTASDPEGRETVLDLVRGVRERLHPVGRLDLQSQGLIILTNDGPLTEALTHPRSSIPRTYRVKVRGLPEPAALARLARGIVLEGRKARPMQARVVRSAGQASWLEVTVREGRKHLVRDALLALGHPVSKLRRVSFGPLELGSLAPGKWRALTEDELAALRKAVAGKGR